eukprot:SAG31_NODE_8962_length_1356_cov_1.390613_2_plen_65_part_00
MVQSDFMAKKAAKLFQFLTGVAPKGSVIHSFSLVILAACIVVAIIVIHRAIDKQRGKKRILKLS